MPDALLVAAGPAFSVDGQNEGSLARDLLWLEIEETTEGLRTLQARFLNLGPRPGGETEDLLYLDGSVLDFGKRIEVALGPSGGDRVVFDGRISALEAGFAEAREPTLTIFAEDALMKLRMTVRSRTYEEVSDADIASQLAGDHGLSPSTAAPGPTYDIVHQLEMSDLAFLRERARLVQAEIWAEGEELHFEGRTNRTGTELTLVQGDTLLAVELRADLAHQRSSVLVSGYDAQSRETIEEEAGGDAVQGEADGGVTGPATLDRALGERAFRRTRDVPLTSAEAQQWARAEMLRRGRTFATAIGVTSGSPDLIVGSRLTLERVGAPFEGGGWYVTRVRHTYDLERGHRTSFSAERANLRSAA
jgi:phage protein D